MMNLGGLLIREFRIPGGRSGTRAKARIVLSAIGCEDILAMAQKVRFNGNDKYLRLTFPATSATMDATVCFSQSLILIQELGNNTDINFTIETPQRFASQRRDWTSDEN